MSEQLIVNSPDSDTSILLKQLFERMNLMYASYKEDVVISEEQKNYVMDILNNTNDEDYLNEDDAKKMILQSKAKK
jgi:hypothetical protein